VNVVALRACPKHRTGADVSIVVFGGSWRSVLISDTPVPQGVPTVENRNDA